MALARLSRKRQDEPFLEMPVGAVSWDDERRACKVSWLSSFRVAGDRTVTGRIDAIVPGVSRRDCEETRNVAEVLGNSTLIVELPFAENIVDGLRFRAGRGR